MERPFGIGVLYEEGVSRELRPEEVNEGCNAHPASRSLYFCLSCTYPVFFGMMTKGFNPRSGHSGTDYCFKCNNG